MRNAPVEEGEHKHDADVWHHMVVDLPHKFLLVDAARVVGRSSRRRAEGHAQERRSTPFLSVARRRTTLDSSAVAK